MPLGFRWSCGNKDSFIARYLHNSLQSGIGRAASREKTTSMQQIDIAGAFLVGETTEEKKTIFAAKKLEQIENKLMS